MSDRSLPSGDPNGSQRDLPAEYYPAPAPAPAPAGWGGDEEEQGLDWRRYVAAIVRNKWLVLAGLVVGLGAGFLVRQVTSPVYSVSSTVLLESTDRGTAGDAAPIRPSQLLTNTGWMDLLRSYIVLDPVVDNLRLYVTPADPAHAPLFEDFSVGNEVFSASYEIGRDASGGDLLLFDSDGNVLERAAPGQPIGAERGIEWTPPAGAIEAGQRIAFRVTRPREVARGLLADLDVRIQGTFMTVGMSGTDPVRTTRVLNGILDRFAIVAEDLKRAKFEELQAILEEQLDYAAQNLQQAEYALEGFKVRTISLPSEQGMPVAGGTQQTTNPVFQNFFNLRVEQDEARRDQSALNRAMARSQQEGRLATEALEVIPSVRESTDLVRALSLASEKRAEVRALSLRYHEDWPEVQALRRDIVELEQQTIPALVGTLQSEMQARESEIERFVGRASSELQQIPPRVVEEARLTREYQSAENLFRDLQGRFENARLGAVSTVPDVRILVRAQVPEFPSSDPRNQFGLMAILAGLALGLVGAIVRDRMDPVLRRPDQVSGDLGLPILATIPHVRSRNGRLRPEDHEQVVEAFRSLRLALAYGRRGAGPLVLTISSPGVGDGKSFTTSNLALACAELGHRTLVIDGDVRRGTLHTLFNLSRRPGLTDFLAGEAELEAVVQSTEHDTMWVIPSGSRLRDGPELLGTDRMIELLDDVRGRFDVILIDSPPLGAAVDPYLLGTLSGSIMLVFRNGTTNQDVAVSRIEELKRLPVQIVGAVLNDVPAGSAAYKSYAYLPGYGVADEEPETREAPEGRRLVARAEA
ncbi:MAG: polysaccharide biosynthesis tyrosine autokinase [Gemmatimonadales bacterium]|nr:MAG: polysaccharide biosynthesis tyrosine autokinase [Gemmatimonadales bacterium]